jgi:hypothetical protein
VGSRWVSAASSDTECTRKLSAKPRRENIGEEKKNTQEDVRPFAPLSLRRGPAVTWKRNQVSELCIVKLFTECGKYAFDFESRYFHETHRTALCLLLKEDKAVFVRGVRSLSLRPLTVGSTERASVR